MNHLLYDQMIKGKIKKKITLTFTHRYSSKCEVLTKQDTIICSTIQPKDIRTFHITTNYRRITIADSALSEKS